MQSVEFSVDRTVMCCNLKIQKRRKLYRFYEEKLA